MSFCRGCGHQIHESALSCPQCGAVQRAGPPVAAKAVHPPGTLWLPVPALVCGLCAVIALLDPNSANPEQALGIGIFACAAIALGIIGVASQKRGYGMSVAGVVLGVIGLLGAIGTQL